MNLVPDWEEELSAKKLIKNYGYKKYLEILEWQFEFNTSTAKMFLDIETKYGKEQLKVTINHARQRKLVLEELDV